MASIAIQPSTRSSLGHIPGPPPTPIIGKYGNTIQLVNDTVGYADRLYKRYGPVAAVVRGEKGVNFSNPQADCPGSVIICGPELTYNYATQHDTYNKIPLTGLLYRQRNVSPRTAPLKHLLTGLFAVQHEQHRKERRMLQPAFSKKNILAYREDMVHITQSVLDGLQIGKRYDIASEARILTSRIATKTLFGQDIAESTSDDAQAAITIQQTFAALANPFTTLIPIDLPGTPYHRFLTIINRFDHEMRTLVARKRKEDVAGNDMLSVLLNTSEEGETFDEDTILGHVGVIFAAGHETSTNAIDWTLLLLSQHPHILADVVDELSAVLHGDAPTLEQLAKLPLLERVIKESMRLLPPAPLNLKILAEPVEIGGYHLPAETAIYLNIYTLHHLPEIYPDPQAFKPERWETINPPLSQYHPFGGGSRMCIGASFAMMEIKIVLAMLLQRFRLQLIPNQTISRFGTITMAPKHGMHVTLHPQDRQFHQGLGKIRGNIHEMVDLPS
ncbi:cytochrome P450 [Tengunoibacter tsumagoiensis]|uniref:Cytochrome P450 n=1 Tax=Tengunoibacter tsumagoiensis TaxID=2014871 RepID=A0A401ZZQ5_9CHLR|nr:cytochrome P450 [Tengunoibacter tsumagoiensis]GCE12281.1 hypothetical protein KTT_21400 [Tengunoibacter tsumagoiensis]